MATVNATASTGLGLSATAAPTLRRFVSSAADLTLETSNPPLLQYWTPAYSLPSPDRPERRLHLPGENVRVYVDGELYQETDVDHLDLPGGLDVRGELKIYDGAPIEGYSPLDRVRLTWAETDNTERYRIERAPISGSYETVATVQETEYLTDPLTDDTWYFKVTAIDSEGDETESDSVTIDVSSTPEPPADLSWSWDPDTQTLTLSWSDSSSADLSSYRVREGEGTLDPTSAPVQDSLDTSYTRTFSGETGLYLYSVRAVDSDGNEEANISEMVALPFEDGSPTGKAAPPTMVDATAVSAGKVELTWHYEPVREYLGPGQAQEARIYWNGGSGDVDYSSPHATLTMDGPEHPQSYTWTSSALTDDQTYKFVVRIATAVSPDGTETQNTGAVEAVPDSDVPGQPTVDAELV